MNFASTGNIFAVLITMLTAIVQSSFEISTCCPRGYNLRDNSIGSLVETSQFVCEPAGDYDIANDTIEGYAIYQSDKVSIPTCDDPFVVKVSSDVTPSKNSCVVKSGNVYYALACTTYETQTLSMLQKCCPAGQSYNNEKRECVQSNISNEVFYMILKNPAIFEVNSFNCPESQVIIEYFWDYHKFRLYDSNLAINNAEKIFNSDSYCLETIIPESDSTISNKTRMRHINFMARTCNNPSVCNRIPCTKKCCKDNEKLLKDDNEEAKCVFHNNDHKFVFHEIKTNTTGQEGLDADVIQPKEFGILRGQNCLKYRLEPNDYPEDVHYFDHKDGSLFIPSTQESYDHSKYCIEFVQMEHNAVEAFTFVCYEGEQKDTIRFILYPAGLGASSVFCLITLLVYLCVPKLRNLPGKILICLVLCLMVSYVILAMGQLNTLEPGSGCYVKAFLLYFSFLGAFTWTNVMSIDIWLVFSSSRNSHLSSKRQQTKKLILYMLYGWGLPATLTLLMVAIDNWLPIAEEFRPHFGENRCWFENFKLTSHILYFILPAGILILSNIILFILTLRYCNKVKRELFRMQSTNEEKPILRQRLTIHKTRLTMNIKMFIVMGVSFALEIVSTLAYNRSSLYFWLLTDFLNTLHGVFIFFIFVFKKKVWYAILDRLGIKYKGSYKSPPSRSTTTTSTVPSHLLRLKSTEDVSHNLLRLKSTESIPKNLVRLKSTDD